MMKMLVASLVLFSAACVVLSGVPLGQSVTTVYANGVSVTSTIYVSKIVPCDVTKGDFCMDWQKLGEAIQARSKERENPVDLIGGH